MGIYIGTKQGRHLRKLPVVCDSLVGRTTIKAEITRTLFRITGPATDVAASLQAIHIVQSATGTLDAAITKYYSHGHHRQGNTEEQECDDK
jgi:hypothetical protein